MSGERQAVEPGPGAVPGAYEHLRLERVGRIGVITLSRARVLNAFNDAMVRELRDAIVALDRDDRIWAVVLHGDGRAFSSGADVRERQLRPEEELRSFGGPEGPGAKAEEMLQNLEHWKPTVAAVHGYVLGMAVGLALECEIVVADSGTRFQVTEIPRGLGGARYAALLRIRGGGAWADEVSVTGRYFAAEEALEHGVINAVTAPGHAFARAMEYAERIVANPPLGTRPAVAMRREQIARSNADATRHLAPLGLHLTEDFRESAQAFVEKRPAGPFVGR